MRTFVTATLAGALSLFGSAAAHAQERVSGWVEGRYLQDRDNTRDHITRVGAGGGIAAGVDLSRRFGFQGSFDWPESHVERTDEVYQSPVGQLRRTWTIRNSAPAFSVYLATHFLTTTRLRLTLLAGFARYGTPKHAHFIEERLAPGGDVVARTEREETDNYRHSGPAFGVEVPVRLASGLSVVPAVRGVYRPLADYGRTGFVRPPLGVRWTF